MAGNPNIGPRLELRQGQSLVMTAQLQQSIKLLQMSSLELREFLEAELERNPLLTTGEGDSAEAPTQDIGPEESTVSDYLDTDENEFWNGENTDRDAGDRDGSDWEGEARLHTSGGSDDDESAGSIIEQTVTGEVSLQAHLLDQLNMLTADSNLRMLGLRLIEQLDEAGYLPTPLPELAATIGCPLPALESALLLMQTMEPAGLFARDLAECLALQLKDRNRYDPAMAMLVANLDLLAAGKREQLMKLCGVDAADMLEMIGELRSLDPKPGSAFRHENTQAVIADVLLKRGRNGAWIVELNAAALPRVLVDRRYLSELHTKRGSEGRKYVTDQLASANWLIKALDQRAHTLLKVATEIAAKQDGFFRHGVTHLKPMTLKDVAAAIGVHESTVSRVTTNKFIGSPRGLFELKYFFTSSLSGEDGEDNVSSKAVQHYIKEMVDAEGEKILSDDAIAAALQARGITVARRTVAKYRDILNIPSSAERKRAKKLS